MLEKAKEVSKTDSVNSQVEYTRWADDIIIQVSTHPSADKVWNKLNVRVREELNKLDVTINEEKTRIVSFDKNERFDFLGFTFIKAQTFKGRPMVFTYPCKKASQSLRNKIKDILIRYKSQPLHKAIPLINPILRGWVEFFRIGNSAKVFSRIKYWLAPSFRRHLRRNKGKSGYGWKTWKSNVLWSIYNIYSDFQIRYWREPVVKHINY